MSVHLSSPWGKEIKLADVAKDESINVNCMHQGPARLPRHYSGNKLRNTVSSSVKFQSHTHGV